jgi:PEP-CTERM motif
MFKDRSISVIVSTGLLVLACTGVWSPVRAGSVSYLVSVDTTGLAGQAGFLDAQLAAAAPPASASVTVTISDVSSDATPGPVTSAVGDVSGSFSSTPLILGNDNAGSSIPGLSELQQSGTYGTFLSFTLTVSGSEVSGGAGVPFTGTVFSFLLEDASQTGLSQGPMAGEAIDLFVNPGGSLTVMSYGPASGNFPQVTLSAAAVPEPSSVVLLALGAVAVFSRLRKGRANI